MSDDVIGPGMGTALGLAWGEVKRRASERADEIDALREELRSSQKVEVLSRAGALAASQVTTEILHEIEDPSVQKAPELRLSDPRNTELRNSAYVDKLVENARRISGGAVDFSSQTIKAMKAKRVIK